MRLGVLTLQLLGVVLWLAFVCVCSLWAYGCSSPGPSCPDRPECSHHRLLERSEIRCASCEHFFAGTEVERWDLRAR